MGNDSCLGIVGIFVVMHHVIVWEFSIPFARRQIDIGVFRRKAGQIRPIVDDGLIHVDHRVLTKIGVRPIVSHRGPVRDRVFDHVVPENRTTGRLHPHAGTSCVMRTTGIMVESASIENVVLHQPVAHLHPTVIRGQRDTPRAIDDHVAPENDVVRTDIRDSKT